jgi:transcriptional regulator with XRE-family HTH domain
MNIDQVLGIDRQDPSSRRAEVLVQEHEALLRDLMKVREANHLSQAEVAKLMGVNPSYVSRIESGRQDLHLSTLRRYAFAVGAVVRHNVVNHKKDSAELRAPSAATWALKPDSVAATQSWVEKISRAVVAR